MTKTVVDFPKEWMGYIPSDTPLNHINIPGTHDTMTYGPEFAGQNSASRCQFHDLKNQLKNGYRYFDMRTWYQGASNNILNREFSGNEKGPQKDIRTNFRFGHAPVN